MLQSIHDIIGIFPKLDRELFVCSVSSMIVQFHLMAVKFEHSMHIHRVHDHNPAWHHAFWIAQCINTTMINIARSCKRALYNRISNKIEHVSNSHKSFTIIAKSGFIFDHFLIPSNAFQLQLQSNLMPCKDFLFDALQVSSIVNKLLLQVVQIWTHLITIKKILIDNTSRSIFLIVFGKNSSISR